MPNQVKKRPRSASANELDTEVAYHNELIIGKWSSKRRTVVLFDMQAVNLALQKLDIKIVDGIIGADVLQSTKAVVDYQNDWLYFEIVFKAPTSFWHLHPSTS
jgi:hypothetical protein